MSLIWRTGRQVGRELYVNDVLVGVMDTERDADYVAKTCTNYPTVLKQLDEAYRMLRDALDGSEPRGGKDAVRAYFGPASQEGK